jgi:hypothetical protein
MIARSRYWFYVLLVWLVAVVACPRSVEAQTLTMAKFDPVKRVGDSAPIVTSGTDATIKLTITRADCSKPNLKFKFSLTVTGYQSIYSLEAWAGRASSNCASEYTALENVKTCWKLGTASVSNSVATFTYTPAELLGIGASGGKPIMSTCNDLITTKGRQSINVTFMLTNDAAVKNSVNQTMYYSMVGPDAPELNDVQSADQSLKLSWDALSGLTTEVTYTFLCAPSDLGTDGCKSGALEALGSPGPAPTKSNSTGSGGSSSTGGTHSAGSDSGGAASAAGTEGELGGSSSSAGAAGETGVDNGTGGTTGTAEGTAGAAGSTVAAAVKFDDLVCGSKRGRIYTTGYTNQTLENDVNWAVAIAVQDTYGNVGMLSRYRCQTPKQVQTFYEEYRDVHGRAGGGFCNLGIHPKGSGLSIAFAALGLGVWFRRRHRKSQAQTGSNSATH